MVDDIVVVAAVAAADVVVVVVVVVLVGMPVCPPQIHVCRCVFVFGAFVV